MTTMVDRAEAELTWDFWKERVRSSRLLSSSGRDLGCWSLNVIRDALGARWLMDRYGIARCVPGEILQGPWWTSAFGLLVRTGMKLQDAASKPSSAEVLSRLRDDPSHWSHAMIQLELSALLEADGADVSFEPHVADERTADLQIRRVGSAVNVEISRLGTSERFQEGERVFEELRARTWRLARQFDLDIDVQVSTLPSESQLTWFESALKSVAVLKRRQFLSAGPITASLRLGGSGIVQLSGPPVLPQSWPRLVRKVRKKAHQTRGGASAWLRIDAMDGLWQIHEFAGLGLEDKARALAAETSPALQQAPHVRGLVVTSGLIQAQGEFRDEMASPFPGVVAMRRCVEPGLVRETVVTSMEPGEPAAEAFASAYANEPAWLRRRLAEEGLPSMARAFRR
jgi:hypothetical protein